MFTFNENEMKTTKTYIQGCNWCNATGIKYPMENYGGTGLTNVCPVCHGLGTIIVTETIDSPDLEKESETSNEDYLNECIAKATPRLSKIKDVDKELDEIRGVEMTCKHYFEFAEWLFMREDHFFGKVENQKTLMFVNFAEGSKKKYTIEEVYNYWLKSVITTKDLTDDDQARAER
jgi:hypothetical protein